ncbi:outer membrane protein [Mesonia algae]|jgi:outer membrane protein|uniref:Outer membrane protein n=1 Tax=Mesonia algae TaxID=213248 RepID=A0A2W7IBD7_9FLAO|nr:OmpH family outer membrane protein [Mesonia algae]PZW44191.1 outer membrane protein [Mesonia algae]|tara:strand:- start:482 stop:994 length:513 start_codon:yes stop_codon:yes gene_type:complete
MKMKKVILLVFGAVVLSSCNQEKTAYVDNTQLIQDFKEMKSTEAKFTKKSEKLKKELDSVAQQFQLEVQQYQQKSASLSSAEKQEKESMLMQKQQQLQRQQQMQSNQLREESDVVIDSLITKVKDFVADYGEKNGYTYIFGSNESANIMYAKEGRDITEEVLKALNESAK